jgi:TRAP-type mannitol/chloroaromatic compound transport system substrate-binding protein
MTVNQTILAAPMSAVASPKTQTPAKPAPAETKQTPDTVQLSSSAQAALAVLKEAAETAAQTAQEAGKGDLQAQRLLAKEAAAKQA